MTASTFFTKHATFTGDAAFRRTTGRQSSETKAGLWAVWAPMRLWSLTLRLWWSDGLPNKALQALSGEYVFESSFSLAHWGNSPKG